MQQLAGLVGQWEGTGWAEVGLGERSSFDLILDVQPLLNGAVLLVQARGVPNPESDYSLPVSYIELRIISYDRRSKSYRVQSLTRGGYLIDWETESADGGLTCWHDDVRAGRTRFAIRVGDDGVLQELGDSKPAVSSAGEEIWDEDYELTLQQRIVE